MLDDYQDLIDELLGTPKLVRAALAAGAGDQAGPARLIAAMLRRDQLVLERLQRIKQQTNPHLKGLPSLEQLLAEAEAAPDPEALLAAFESARGDLVSLLMNLTLRDWERTATSEAGGIVTLADEVETHVEFDEERRADLDDFGPAA